jgi:hypothetical protein
LSVAAEVAVPAVAAAEVLAVLELDAHLYPQVQDHIQLQLEVVVLAVVLDKEVIQVVFQ